MFQEKRGLIIKQIKRHIGFCFEYDMPMLLLRELEFRLIHAHAQTDRSDLGSGDLSVATAGRHPAPCL